MIIVVINNYDNSGNDHSNSGDDNIKQTLDFNIPMTLFKTKACLTFEASSPPKHK